MLGLEFGSDSPPRRVLCLGAHADDIEIGCGGTILRLLAVHPEISIRWVVFSASEQRAEEARRSARFFLQTASESEIIVQSFKDGFFPYQGADIKRFFERELKDFAPDLVLTHYRDDRHQDHRIISGLTWNTFRDHLILEYEIPKYDGDLGQPNFFVPLDEAHCQTKVDAIMQHFTSQQNKQWFSRDTFQSLLRLRGIESATQYAEAFYARKLRW